WRGSASELSVGITLTPPSSTLFPYPTLFRSYPAVTTRFFHRFGLQPEVVPLHGSIELAPLVGLADGVVDITETGRTLRANGLRRSEEHTSELQSRENLVCRLLLENKKYLRSS